MKKIMVTIIPCVLLMLSGCASLDYVQGTEVSNGQISNFKEGKTTKKEVIAELGGPQNISFQGNKQVLVYKYQKIAAMPFAPNESYNTTFVFNKKNGLLEEMYKSNSAVSNPLLGD
jgi:outer membrane protein assembly factor BamE (lipoprotein component of BamABCDE complex)